MNVRVVGFSFQESLAQAYAEGLQWLLNAPTGSGKTYAMFLPALCYSISQGKQPEEGRASQDHLDHPSLRALARDIMNTLRFACDNDGVRMAGTDAYRRTDAKQTGTEKENAGGTYHHSGKFTCAAGSQRLPALFSSLEAVVVDEWHELLGVQTRGAGGAGPVRVKNLVASHSYLGISPTIGNLVEAMLKYWWVRKCLRKRPLWFAVISK